MNILEEYLVKIGAVTDSQSFHNAQNLIDGLSGSISKFGNLLRWGGIAGLLAGLTKGIADQIKSVAELDMQYQKLAKDMWVTKETAKQLSVIKGIMKASDTDIAWIPELREQFFRLRQEMQALATPPDADGQLKWVRSIGYEVESLQVKLKMFREWLVYYLIKYLQPVLADIKQFIQWLNKQFGENLPTLANKLAYALSKFISLITSAGRLVMNVARGIKNFFDGLPERVQKIVPILAAAGAAIMAGPFGLLIAAVGGALILLEDFFYFLDGKKSSSTLAPMWAALIKFANGTGFPMLDTIKTGLSDILEILTDIFENLSLTETMNSIGEALDNVVGGVFELIKGLQAFFKTIGLGKPEVRKIFDIFTEMIMVAIRLAANLTGAVGRLFKAIGLALEKKYGAASTEALGAIKDVFMAIPKAVAPVWNRNDQRPADGQEQESPARQWYNKTVKTSGFRMAGGDDGSISRAQSIVNNPTSDFMGNSNGCTYFVSQAVGTDNEFMQAVGAASGGLWVPDWVLKAKEMGRFHEGVSGMKKGDIIVYDYDSVIGDGDHVVLYDGQGGAYGNSSSRGEPMYYPDANSIGNIMGYIDMGGTSRPRGKGAASAIKQGLSGNGLQGPKFGPQSDVSASAAPFFQPAPYSYAAGFDNIPLPGLTGSENSQITTNNATDYHVGSINIYTDDPKKAGDAVMTKFRSLSTPEGAFR